MTEPDDAPPDARWCARVAAALTGASERAGRLAFAIADDWRDGHGQEWAERTTLLHRELGRVAAEAAEMGAAIARRATALVPGQDWPVPHRAAGVARDHGPRLGVVAGDRTETDLGMRIAQLPEPD